MSKHIQVPEGADDIGRGDIAVDDAIHTKSGRASRSSSFSRGVVRRARGA